MTRSTENSTVAAVAPTDALERIAQTDEHCAVVGLQYGDEGKGQIVDVLSSKYDLVVRYNGGANQVASRTSLNQAVSWRWGGRWALPTEMNRVCPQIGERI